MHWINWFIRKFRGSGEAPASGEPDQTAAPTRESAAILRWIEMTREEELPCDEVLEHIAQFAELDLAGENATQLLPLVEEHLKLCADCQDEYQALVRVLKENGKGGLVG